MLPCTRPESALMRIRPLLLHLLFLCSAPGIAAQVPAGSHPVPGSGEARPSLRPGALFAVQEPGGTYALWTADERLQGSSRRVDGVEFLAIHLVGYPYKDRLRLDRPGLVDADATAPWVELRVGPAAGSALYLVRHTGRTRLVRVKDAHLRELLSVSDIGGVPGLALEVHVSPDGTKLAVAASPEAGGQVYVIDVATGLATDVTAGLGNLGVSPASMRVGSSHLWFVASGRLYREDLSDAAPPAEVVLSDEELVPELVLATQVDAVAALVESSDGTRQVFCVFPDASFEAVTGFGEYSAPSDHHPLGPWMALSPHAEYLAYREEIVGGTHELFIARLGEPDPVEHITREPEFPGYVDNVGSLAFGDDDLLCFFGGDKARSGVETDVELGAADMYAARLSPDGIVSLNNVTRTNDFLDPPFTRVSELRFSSAHVGPLGLRIFLVGQKPSGAYSLHSFFVDGGFPLDDNAELVISDSGTQPVLAAVGGHVGVLVHPIEVLPPALISCQGDPREEFLVQVKVTDNADPGHPNPAVFFEGMVTLGGVFEADSSLAGGPHLSERTFFHVFSQQGEWLHTAEIKADCNESLELGSRYGAQRLVGYEGQLGEMQLADTCVHGARPQVLVMQYTGADCMVTSHDQDANQVACSGDPALAGPVNIIASDKSNPNSKKAKVWYEGDVPLDGFFRVDALLEEEDQLKATTYLQVRDSVGDVLQAVEFDTSCSQPIRVGDRFGSTTVIEIFMDWEFAEDDLCHSGRPVRMSFEYVGLGCEAVDQGPVPMVVPAGLLVPEVSPLELFEQQTTLDRLTPSPDGNGVYFVSSSSSAVQQVCYLDLESNAVEVLYQGSFVDEPIGFTRKGHALVTVDDGGGYRLLRLAPGAAAAELPLAGRALVLGR